jgi:hypothetical protein
MSSETDTAEENPPPHRRRGQWVQAGVTGLAFPNDVTTVIFRSRQLHLIPGKPRGNDDKFGGLYPVVAVEHTGMSFEDGQRLISAFINSIAWVRKAAISTSMFTGGTHLHGLGGKDADPQTDDRFALDYLPDPGDDKARLALAFYREGMTLNSTAYQCLSYFKILNLLLSDGKAQIAWIDENIGEARKLEAFRTKDWEKNVGLDQNKETAGNYLYVSNRCAVAHAHAEPLVDPDDPVDRQRLANDLPMVRALAEYMIEREFGVKSDRTVWQEHLYELQGFADLFGVDLVARIKSGEEVPLAEVPELPPLSMRLAFHEPFPSFEGMAVEVIDCAEGKLNLVMNSKHDVASVLLVLSFTEERLEFEVFQHLATRDDGHRAGAQAELDRLRFVDSYLGNGKLEIWSASERLSRKDAYLPVNIDFGRTHDQYGKWIAAATTVLHERS